MVETEASPMRVLERHGYVPHYLMVLANGMASGQSRLYLRQLGLGLNECRILTTLAYMPGLQGSEMSEVLSMNKSIVSRSIASLLKRGMIERVEPTGPRRMRLTPRGIVRHADVVEVALERERRLMHGFSPPEKTALLAYLARMFANMEIVDAYGGLQPEAGSPRKRARPAKR